MVTLDLTFCYRYWFLPVDTGPYGIKFSIRHNSKLITALSMCLTKPLCPITQYSSIFSDVKCFPNAFRSVIRGGVGPCHGPVQHSYYPCIGVLRLPVIESEASLLLIENYQSESCFVPIFSSSRGYPHPVNYHSIDSLSGMGGPAYAEPLPNNFTVRLNACTTYNSRGNRP